MFKDKTWIFSLGLIVVMAFLLTFMGLYKRYELQKVELIALKQDLEGSKVLLDKMDALADRLDKTYDIWIAQRAALEHAASQRKSDVQEVLDADENIFWADMPMPDTVFWMLKGSGQVRGNSTISSNGTNGADPSTATFRYKSD